MRSAFAVVAASLLVGSGCGGAETSPAAPDLGLSPPDVGGVQDSGAPPDCSVPLTVVAASASVEALTLFTVRARGGSGSYRFTLTENNSGGLVNATTGAYLAGETRGVVDVVRVEDATCGGEASVSIRVVQALLLSPARSEVPPGTSWRFEVSGGSGRFMIRPVELSSGGSLDEQGNYRSGSAAGLDKIEARDLDTGQTVEALVVVSLEAAFRVTPEVVLIAEGERFELELTGGSGQINGASLPAFVSLEGSRTFRAVAAGATQLELVDRFTAQTATVSVRVAAPLRYPTPRSGDLVDRASMAGGQDFNGDGLADLVLGHPDADTAAANGGAVFVYRGNAAGMSLVQTLAGGRRSDQLGASVAVVDLDGDGRLDLIAGAPGADLGANGNGAAYIYPGTEDGSFEQTPSVTFAGRIAGDALGSAIVACDFDMDGRLDVAVGAGGAEDRTRTERAFNQGGVFIFSGAAAGFAASPDEIIWGDLPDSTGALVGYANLRYGERLAAADVNGDGACDLVVGAPEWEREGETDDGLIAVHLGGPGGLSRSPEVLFGVTDDENRGARLGFAVAAGDLDGDGLAEIVAGAPGHDSGSGDGHGAVRIFSGATSFAPPLRVRPARTEASWSYEHEGGFDDAGWSVALGDLDGDGRPDLLVGAIDDEVAGGPGGAGTLLGFVQGAGGLEMTPSRIEGGASGGDRLGVAALVLGDLDRDGGAELVGFAGRDDTLGADVGAPLLFFSEGSTNPIRLDLPGPASGARYGASVALVGDLTGDGRDDLLVGAPGASAAELGRGAGAAHLYGSSRSGGVTSMPTLDLTGFVGHGSGDGLGQAVSRLGDFNGDGVQDFAVVARFDDLPRSRDLDETRFVVDPACPTGGASNVGAVQVFLGALFGAPSGTPAFIVYGPQPGDGLEAVAGGFDFDGDGLDDLAIGSGRWDRTGVSNGGGYAVVRGRAAPMDSRIAVVCTMDVIYRGRRANDAMGTALAGLGDVDGDGCDELAVGAAGFDGAARDEGEVEVLFGSGGAGCPAQPERLILRSGLSGARFGAALAGAVDVDGDAVPDLAVGLPGYAAAETVGAAAVISGRWLAARVREPALDDQTPMALSRPLDGGTRLVLGDVAGAAAGSSVALFRSGGAGYVSMGVPGGQRFGGAGAGYAVAHRVLRGGGVVSDPWLAMSGEASRPGGNLGSTVVAGDGLFVVGGPDASAVAPDNGAVYAFPLAP